MSKYPFRSALVTGASSGIGEAMARILAADGVHTIVVARRAERLSALAAELPNVEVLAADLLDPAGVQAVADRLADADRSVDLVVNNAGFGTSGAFHTIDADRLADEIGLNITALTRLSRAAAEVMVARRQGWILNVSSVVSFQPGPGLAVYAATKAYVTSLTEALHEELRSSGVKVTNLCPGLTRTEFQSVSSGEEFAARYPSFAWLTAEQVARDGLDACARGRATSIPGLAYKGVVGATRFIPRSAMRRLSGLATTKRH